MKINAKTKAPVSVAAGENERSVARLKKYDTTLMKAMKIMSVVRIVVSIVPLSWLRLAIDNSTSRKFLALKA